MRPNLVVVIAVIAAAFIAAPHSSAGDAPIGHAVRAGSIVRGGVDRKAYRDPVATVVLLDDKTGYHLAQWNL